MWCGGPILKAGHEPFKRIGLSQAQTAPLPDTGHLCVLQKYFAKPPDDRIGDQFL